MPCRAWNPFLEPSTTADLTLLSLNRWVLNLAFVDALVRDFFSLILTSATDRLWSICSSFSFLIKQRECLHMPLIIKWSIWFLSIPFGEFKISLYQGVEIESLLSQGYSSHKIPQVSLRCHLSSICQVSLWRWARQPVNHSSWVAVVTPSDRPKSVRNRYIIELFLWRCLCCHFTFLTILLV